MAFVAAPALVSCALISGADELVFDAADAAPTVVSMDGAIPESSSPPRPDASGSDASASTDASTDGSDGSCAPKSDGPRYGASVSADLGWSAADGARLPDGVSATGTDDNAALRVSGFGFTLPATAKIVGVTVGILRRGAGSVSDVGVRLRRGVSKKEPATWPGTFVTAVYGGPTDTWGVAWTATEIDAATFNVELVVNTNDVAHVDSIGVTITYTECP